MNLIKKYDKGNPITTGGAGYIPAAQPTQEQLRNAANKLGEWFLRGLGFVGDLISTGIAAGTRSPNVPDFMNEEILNQRKEAAGKVFGALSPLNYGVAVATGNGLNPYKGEEEIATWEPYQQALARGLELYLTPKAVKAGKAGIQRGIQEVKYKMLPYQEGYKYPIGYDSNGRLYANKNFFFRQGWDLIDDAEKTGVIRVPEGDYKPAVLKKYPFLDDGFSTMQESFKFPYFGKGSTSHFKFGIEPDLIAIPDQAPNTRWVGASKWGELQPDVTPTFESHRATPLYKGQTNKFPTSKTFRFKYNEATGQYEPVVGKVKFGRPSDFPEEGWTPFEDWPTHLKNAFNKVWGKGTKSYTSPQLSIFPVEGDINTGYVVENYPGYQIKSLMAGSPLEKWLSKTGTINVNQLRGYLNKATKLEQNIVEKVLKEKFNGQNVIDYNQLKKAVQDELITYTRTPQQRWATYGLDRLGYEIIKEHDGAGGIVEYARFPVQTFTFESPRLTVGSGKHYDNSSLGHSRTFTTKTEPEVLHVLESQSDWGQKPLPDPITDFLSETEYYRHQTNALERFQRYVPEEWQSEYERLISDAEKYNGAFPDEVADTYSQEFKDFINQFFESKFNEPSHDAIYRLHKAAYVPDPQRAYLHDNYPRRQLQENLKYAAEREQTKVRYPTRETAATIEGFEPVPKEGYYIEVNEDLANYLRENSRKLTPYSYELLELKTKLDKTSDPIKRNNILSEMKRIQRIEDKFLNGETTYTPKHESILDKYSTFPKVYDKLYKNQKINIVTDAYGNTWYEIEVPQNYLSSEWQYKKGGKLKSKK